jgi:ribosomal protein S18 acetylase RimI-like enzyme
MTDATVELSIRDATLNDLDAVVELDGAATSLAKPDYWNDIFDRYIVNPRGNRYFLVAETADSTVGFIVGETRMWEFGSPSCGWVFAVNVAESVREHGVGTRLMNAICERFRKTGVDTVRTMISRNDPLNLSFFRGQGMTAGPYIELEKNLD